MQLCALGGSISNSSQGATVNCLYLGRYTVDYSTNLHLPFPLTYLQTQQNISHCTLETHDLWVGRKVEDRIYKEINSLYSSISFFPLFAFSFHPLEAAATSASFYLSCEKEALKLKARFVQILLLLRLAHANASSSLFGILSARRSLYNWNIKPHCNIKSSKLNHLHQCSSSRQLVIIVVFEEKRINNLQTQSL